MRAATVARKVCTLWTTGHPPIRQCVVKWLFGADNSDAALDAEVQAALMPLADCVKMVLDCASSPEVAGKNDVVLNDSAQQILRHLRDSQEQFEKAQKIQRVAKTMHLVAASQMWMEVHKLPGSKVLQDVPCPALEQFKDKWTPDYIEHVFSDHSSGTCTDVGTSRNPFYSHTNQEEMVRCFSFSLLAGCVQESQGLRGPFAQDVRMCCVCGVCQNSQGVRAVPGSETVVAAAGGHSALGGEAENGGGSWWALRAAVGRLQRARLVKRRKGGVGKLRLGRKGKKSTHIKWCFFLLLFSGGLDSRERSQQRTASD